MMFAKLILHKGEIKKEYLLNTQIPNKTTDKIVNDILDNVSHDWFEII